MDTLTRYYLRKANLKVQDEFQDKIDKSDIVLLEKARSYMIIAPFFTVGCIYFLRCVQSTGGVAKYFNFRGTLMGARTNKSEFSSKWDATTGTFV